MSTLFKKLQTVINICILILLIIGINCIIVITPLYAQGVKNNVGLTALYSLIKQHQSLSGEFIQTVKGKKTRQTGSFAMNKPDQFRWEIKTPFKQLLLSDGMLLTQWDSDLNQATQRKAQGLLNNTPAALLLGDSNVEKQFILEDVGESEGLHFIHATPKNNQEGQFKRIELGFKNGLPAVLIAYDAFGGVSRIDFKAIKFTPIQPQYFKFNPPQGTEIVRL